MNMVKVLTYNVSWENMSGNTKDNKCIIMDANNKKYNQCRKNILNKIFGKIRYDFIALQEAVFSKEELNNICKQYNYNYYLNRSGKESMLTLYDKKYNLLNVNNGEFQKGRPWCILLFENICIINVHLGHFFYNHEHQIQDSIDKINLKNNNEIKNCTIIMMGDFNHNIKKIKFNSYILKELKNYITYCGFQNKLCSNKKNRGKKFDHILSNSKIVDNYVLNGYTENNEHASDHLPVIAEIIIKDEKYKYLKYKEKYILSTK